MIPVKIPEEYHFRAAFPIDDEIVADGGTGIKDFQGSVSTKLMRRGSNERRPR
jgi:hypothetical protein